MRILYIGNERRNAEAVAAALRSMAPKVTLLWVHSLDQCARCLDENRDLAALVMDAQIHAGKWPSSLKDLRSLEVRPAIVIVVPEGTRPKFESLGPPADGYVTNGQTFLRDLPLAVTRAVNRVRGSQPGSPARSDNAESERLFQVTPELAEEDDDVSVHLERTSHLDLEQKLADATAALQNAQQRHAVAISAALVAHELAATEQLTQQEREFQVEIKLEREKRRTVEEMLAEATSALEEAERRYASALTDAAAQTRELEQARALAAELAERQRHADRELLQAAADRDRLEERSTAAEAALDNAQAASRLATVEIERLRQDKADLSAQVADLKMVREDLGHRLIDASRTIERAGQHEAELVEQSERERAMRVALEQAVADADATLRETRQRHDAALAAAAGVLAEHRAQFDRELSRAAVECDSLRARLNEAESALNQSRQDHDSAAADVARLTQREAALSAELARVQGAQQTLEGKLSDALREIADAREDAARERGAAEKRRADLEFKLVQEIDAREILERTLNETRSAALDAERSYREETDALRAQGVEREASFAARLASDRLEYENRLAEMQNECDRVGQARAAADEDVQRLSADLSEATRVLEDTRREFQHTIDRLSTEHATALAAFTVLIAERNERLKEEAVRHDVSLRASERARTELQDRLQAALAIGRDEIEQVQEKLMATVEALKATQHRREVLQAEVDRSAELQEQGEENRANNLRLFEQPRRAALQCN